MPYFIFIILYLIYLPSWATIYPYQQGPSPLVQALIIGTAENGRVYYLCRGQLFNRMFVGKTWYGYHQCTITYQGKEHALNQFTIPNQAEFGNYHWSTGLEKAIKISTNSDGTSLYLCQAQLNGSLQPGITWSGYNHCIIAYDGLEVITDIFRILSRK